MPLIASSRVLVPLDQRLAAALDPRLDPEQEARRALRVQVPEQGPAAVGGGQVGQVDGRGRLADAALDVVGGEDLHGGPRTRAGRGRAPGPPGRRTCANLAANSARASAWLSASFAAISPMASSVAAGAAPFGQHRVSERRGSRARCTSLSWNSPRQSWSCLRSLSDLPVRHRVVQRREELQQVAQLLGALAQVMQGFRGRVRGDRGAVRDDPPERAAGRGQGQARPRWDAAAGGRPRRGSRAAPCASRR